MSSDHQSAFRVLLVGSGPHSRESHGPALQALSREGVVLAALASPNDGRRRVAAAELGIEHTYRSLSEALDAQPVDGVVIVAPVDQHEPLTTEALERGCHVLCEKPMAPTLDAAIRMARAAERVQRTLAIGYQFPWMHLDLRELAAAGPLAGAYRAELRWTRQNGIPDQPAFWNHPNAGPGEDLLGHLLSVLRLGFPYRIEAVTARAWNQLGQRAHGTSFRGHDTLEALLHAADGRLVHALVSWAITAAEPERATVTIQAPDVAARVSLLPSADADPLAQRLVRTTNGDVREQPTAPPLLSVDDAFVAQARNWVHACRGAEPLRFTAWDAVELQAILEAVATSARTNATGVAVDELAYARTLPAASATA